jgi:transcriptional regulator with XRE-family HTH domain
MPKRSNKEVAAFDLKAEREKRNLSQEQTAEVLFQSQGTISRWEISGQTPELARAYWNLFWSIEDAKHDEKKSAPTGRVKGDRSKSEPSKSSTSKSRLRNTVSESAEQ